MKKLIYNAGRIHLRNNNTDASSILIEDGVITALGNKETFTDGILRGTEMIDAEGAVILPGFIDSHIHLCYLAEETLKINLAGLLSREAILEHIRTESEKIPQDKPILCCNWEYDFMPLEQIITADDLDRIVPGREILVEERSGHLSVTNQFTLSRAGFDWKDNGCRCPDAPSVFTGKICGKVNSGLGRRFSGKLFTPDTLKFCLKIAAKKVLSKGVTGVHIILSEAGFDSLCDFFECLPIHSRIYTETKNVGKVYSRGLRQIGGCGPVIVDGDTTPYTAAFFEPYLVQPGTKGILYYSDEELYAYVHAAHEKNMQIGLHCIGDAASDQLLRVYEKVLAEDPRPLRHRIEHYEFANDEMIRRTAAAGVCLSIQPAFNHLWPHDTYIEDLGEERALQADRIGSLIRAGIHVSFGSDAPVTPCDPLLAIHSAVNHSNPAERIDVRTAIDCQTYQSAYCGFEEDRYGSIETGKTADLIFLDRDPLSVPLEEIKDIRVLRTMRAGEIVFEA